VGPRNRLRTVPNYIWTFLALIFGIGLGGFLPETLAPVATATAFLIRLIVTVVPLLIFAALSPSIATLIRRGLAGRFAGSVILWYGVSSSLAGLLGLVISSLLFGIPFTTEKEGAWSEPLRMLGAFDGQSSASLPLLAILGAVVAGAVAAWVDPLYRYLSKVEKGIASLGDKMAYAMAPVVLLFGVSLGVKFGARLGMAHYFGMTLYTAVLCFGWFLLYFFVIMGYLAKQPLKKVLTLYYVPTAVFAAGTCSSLATLPVNLVNTKKYGVRDEVADFVVPFGAIANMNASALMYVAYAPFVISYVFGMEVSWIMMLTVAPALVLFTVAAPGLPVGIGTALWTATLFASMLGLEEPMKSNFVLTWLALSGGLPDMFRTATNCTGDGFTAIVFDHFFDSYFSQNSHRSPVTSRQPARRTLGAGGSSGDSKE
jgi:Na+/H+-dicarboxylate symporter